MLDKWFPLTCRGARCPDGALRRGDHAVAHDGGAVAPSRLPRRLREARGTLV